MGYLWVMTIGFVICLGLVGGTLLYFISTAFNLNDASRIDLLDSKKTEQKMLAARLSSQHFFNHRSLRLHMAE